jgi:hypothetical protein
MEFLNRSCKNHPKIKNKNLIMMISSLFHRHKGLDQNQRGCQKFKINNQIKIQSQIKMLTS